uniref:Uncharacterized protein n=1 Tax=Cacopsylla melanoneura TaxID=428564 RepID=A0A8D8PNV1_9HEMI
MYSVVAHQQNYGRKERRPESRAQASSQQQSSSSHQDGTPRSRRKNRKPFTVRVLDYIKRRFNPVKEEEIDEFNIHVSRYRPEELTKLAKTTKFTRKEIQLIYRGFKQTLRSTHTMSSIQSNTHRPVRLRSRISSAFYLEFPEEVFKKSFIGYSACTT